MVIVFFRKKVIGFFVAGLIVLGVFSLIQTEPSGKIRKTSLAESEIYGLIDRIFRIRNQIMLKKSPNNLEQLYDRSERHGIWAYEHQVKKHKYLHKWCNKQGAKLTFAKSLIRLRRVQADETTIKATLLASTEYRYIYTNEPQVVNRMRIGTYHSLNLVLKDNLWRISREWYTDPFADALDVSEAQTVASQQFISTQPARNFADLNPRRIKAIAYADEYCGAAADEERGFKYNEKYRNYNYTGGDCANFASQILYEGAGFPKTRAWNYYKGGSSAWVNAHAFNCYMLNSGRASKIAYGNYEQVLRASYQLLPGDYIAYEKKGKVAHISVVTGADSKGYTLTNSHNADRYRVPWDLGYGNKLTRFWLVRVHY